MDCFKLFLGEGGDEMKIHLGKENFRRDDGRVWCVIANCVNNKHIRYRYKETIMIETFLEGFVFGGF